MSDTRALHGRALDPGDKDYAVKLQVGVRSPRGRGGIRPWTPDAGPALLIVFIH